MQSDHQLVKIKCFVTNVACNGRNSLGERQFNIICSKMTLGCLLRTLLHTDS